MTIHPSAIVDDGAEIGKNVVIGPFCQVGAEVRLGDGVFLQSHVVVEGATEIGADTQVGPFSVLGGPPQHLGCKGEDTRLVIGAGNIIREHVTMNRGTAAGRGVTSVGDNGFFMVGSHIGHDCRVGDHAILANGVAVGGHVVIGNHVFLGGLCAVHQNGRVGDFAFIGGCAAVTSDIIPYASVMGNHAKLVGLNIIGMKRRGLARQSIHELRNAYRMLFYGTDTFKERVAKVRKDFAGSEEVERILAFIDEDAARTLMTPAR